MSEIFESGVHVKESVMGVESLSYIHSSYTRRKSLPTLSAITKSREFFCWYEHQLADLALPFDWTWIFNLDEGVHLFAVEH